MRDEALKTLRLALPIIIGELAQMSLHLIDSAMVGAISYKHLAASALVLNVMNIPFVFAIGMTISVSQMVSMAHGRHDGQLVSHYFFNGFCICALTALIISAGLIAGKNILSHLGQDPEVVKLALPFMQLMGLSFIPMLLVHDVKAVCRRAGNYKNRHVFFHLSPSGKRVFELAADLRSLGLSAAGTEGSRMGNADHPHIYSFPAGTDHTAECPV